MLNQDSWISIIKFLTCIYGKVKCDVIEKFQVSMGCKPMAIRASNSFFCLF